LCSAWTSACRDLLTLDELITLLTEHDVLIIHIG